MEIVQLKRDGQSCPPGTLPFFHTFGSRFQCIPISGSGALSGNGLGGWAGVSTTTLILIGTLFGGLAWLSARK